MPFEKLIVRLLHGVHLVHRPMTLGVRGAVFDPEGRVFLVEHTYVSGWHLPGGGVDPGETSAAAMKRELREEGNLDLLGEPGLVAVYFNRHSSNRDHVLLFRCGAFRQGAEKRPDGEIAATGFFALDDLPEGTTPATRRRLDELAAGGPCDPFW